MRYRVYSRGAGVGVYEAASREEAILAHVLERWHFHSLTDLAEYLGRSEEELRAAYRAVPTVQ